MSADADRIALLESVIDRYRAVKSELLETLDASERQRDVAKSQRDVARSEEARLTAELTEARRERDDARLAADGAQNNADQATAAHERTKASISDAFTRLESELMARAKSALAIMEDGATKALADVEAERDAAQADAEALREALTTLLGVGSPVGSAQRQGHDTIDGGCHCGVCELSRELAALDTKEQG